MRVSSQLGNNGTAVISTCGTYRYVLKRRIPCLLRWDRPCLFIMLNPSVANAEVDDPTIRRCMNFAARESCTALTVINLFALRTTDPEQLRRHSDPCGPENKFYQQEELNKHGERGPIVCAWGAHPIARCPRKSVKDFQGFLR